jgi:L-threonylcarbamoyladenylate synthase
LEVFKITNKNFNKIIKIAARAIKEGKVLICPTDTVYGLLCDATNENTIKRLLKIKRRPNWKPVPIFIRDVKTAKKLAFVNKSQEKFLRKFWPGKVTFILRRKNNLLRILSGNKKTVGLRIPNYKFINILLEKLNVSLTGTSANISGLPASTKVRDIINQFKNKNNQPDLILDAGNLKPSSPSTVIDLTGKRSKILRK